MLILPLLPWFSVLSNFNTSHVNVNRESRWLWTGRIYISIHLMLMLIYNNHNTIHHNIHISIHLMLMLINNKRRPTIVKCDFNTSHVNVNRFFLAITSLNRKISIHLMLMLIDFSSCVWFYRTAISIHLMLMLICYRYWVNWNSIIISIHLMLMLILCLLVFRSIL